MIQTKYKIGRIETSVSDCDVSFRRKETRSTIWVYVISTWCCVVIRMKEATCTGHFPSLPSHCITLSTMSPPSALSTEDKAKVKKTLSSNNKILTATVARIYEARQGDTRCVNASFLSVTSLNHSSVVLQMELYRNSGLSGVLLRQERRRVMVSRRRSERESSDESRLTAADIFSQGSRGVIWEHELPLEINYVQEQAFFHTFAGDVRPRTDIKVFLLADVASFRIRNSRSCSLQRRRATSFTRRSRTGANT